MKIKHNVFDWAALGVSFAACLAAGIVLLIRWKEIPKEVATHFSMSGEANGFSDKSMLLIILAVAAGLVLLFQIIMHFPGLWKFPIEITDRNRYTVYRLGKYMMDTMMITLAVGFSSMLICMTYRENMPNWAIFTFLGALLGGSLIWTIIITVKGKADA